LLGSNDGGESFSAAISGSGTGYCLAVDTGMNPPSFFAGTGFPERKTGGDVFQSQNPTGGDWTSVGLSRGKVLALAVQRIGGQPIALAAVDGAGVWRRSGAGSWQQVSTDASMPLHSSANASDGVTLAWPPGPTAYLYDRQSGLWRSGDSGQTWTQVWTQGSGPAFTGWVAGDPTRPGRVYVSIGDRGLYVLDGAGSGSVESGQIHPVRVGTFQHPGPIAVDPQGRLFATELGTGGAPDLRVSTDAGATWHSVADDTYRATAVFPLSITPGPGGLVHVSLNGDGLLIGRVKL
jgi:hypothetical protein